MIDLTETITRSQIALALVIIAFSLTYIAFGKKFIRFRK